MHACSYSKWDSTLTYNVHLLTNTSNNTCKPLHGGSAFFYPQTLSTPQTCCSNCNYTITSRQLVTTATEVTLPIDCMLNDTENKVTTDEVVNMDNNNMERLKNLTMLFGSFGESDEQLDFASTAYGFISILGGFHQDFEFDTDFSQVNYPIIT